MLKIESYSPWVQIALPCSFLRFVAMQDTEQRVLCYSAVLQMFCLRSRLKISLGLSLVTGQCCIRKVFPFLRKVKLLRRSVVNEKHVCTFLLVWLPPFLATQAENFSMYFVLFCPQKNSPFFRQALFVHISAFCYDSGAWPSAGEQI
jgi:hypothetical protein